MEKDKNMNQYELLGKLKDIQSTMKALLKSSPEECVKMARKCFEDVHHNQIANLLFNFPLDHVNKETGIKFWTNPKRPPYIIEYDSSDEKIMDFIYSAANIFAFIYNQPEISK